MIRRGATPIAFAVTLSVAAGLTIAQEHAGRWASHDPLPAAQASNRAVRGKVAEGDGPRQANGDSCKASANAGATGSQPAARVGSRALTGNDAEDLNEPPVRLLPDRAPE
jgi:hypothetical protein